MMRTNIFFVLFIFLGFNQLVCGEKTEGEASNNINNYNIAFQKNSEWIAKLKSTDKNVLAFADSFNLKYEIRDIIIYLKNVTDIMREYNYEKFSNENLKRQFQVMLENNYYNLPNEETIEVAEAIDKWNDEFIDVEEQPKYCQFKNQTNCNLSFPEVFSIMGDSKDAQELKWYCIQILDRNAEKRDKNYLEFLKLFNKAAKLNGFSNSYQMLIAPYEDKNIGEKIEKTKNEIKNLYDMIHFEQLKKLKSGNYGLSSNDEYIPQYLWIKTVRELYDPTIKITYPIENAGNADYTTLLKEKGNSSMEIYEMAKAFFNSLGLDTENIKNKVTVDENRFGPVFVDKFGRRELKLHLSPQVNELNVLRTYLQMFYMLQYQYSYEKQPYSLRKLRPKAFSLALGNALALSVQSPSYWYKIGFIEKSSLSLPHLINRLYKFSLMLLLPLQEHYVVADTMKCIQQQKTNDTSKCDYWGKKKAIQGVFLEGRTSDLEVLVSKHNGINIDDYEDIFSIILGFQIYEGLCKKVGQYSDENKENYLAQCDLSDSKKVGEILGEIMADGGSKPWQEHFRKLSDDVDISAKSMLKYFEPLEKYILDKTH